MSKRITAREKDKQKMLMILILVTIGALLFSTLYVMKQQTKFEQQAYYNTAR